MLSSFSILLLIAAATSSVLVHGLQAEAGIAYDGSISVEAVYGVEDIEEWMEDDDLDWEELEEDQQLFLSGRGWTEAYWDCRVDEESLLTWSQLSEERKINWKSRGWQQERWDNEDKCQLSMQVSTPEAFKPLLVNLTVPELEELTMDRLREEKVSVRMVDGYSEQGQIGNEEFTVSMDLEDIVSSAKNGSTDFYLHLEEGMREKRDLQEKVGDKVIDALLKAIKKNDIIAESGLWDENWNNLDKGDYDWALFLGAKSTTTLMHYDSDMFNVIYVLEGKKRFVMLPNDERTDGMFETWLNEDGGTGWGRYDLLDTSKPLPEHAVEVVINAGQALVIPYVCWHAVENLETGLAYSLRVLD
jgi:hypothetical protein